MPTTSDAQSAQPTHDPSLSQYEIERLERIARNARFMASIGLGEARDAFAAPSGWYLKVLDEPGTGSGVAGLSGGR